MDSGQRTRLASSVLEQTSLLGEPEPIPIRTPRAGEPKPLTERQQFTLDLVTAAGRQGLNSDDVGAAWCAHRGKHDTDERCQWCGVAGREVLRALRRRGLVRSRRTGEWYATNLPPETAIDPDVDPFPEGY